MSSIRKYVPLFCSVVAMTVAHAAVYYEWTGAAGDGKWTTPGNWSPNSGYPDGEDDIVSFRAGEGNTVTVELDTGCHTEVSFLRVMTGTVILTASEGSSLNFLAKPLSYAAGIFVDEGATLDLSAPLALDRRVDRWGTGTIHFRSSVTNTFTDKSYWSGGTNIFESGSDVNLKGSLCIGWGNGKLESERECAVILKDDAKFALSGDLQLSAQGTVNRSVAFAVESAEAEMSVGCNVTIGKGTSMDCRFGVADGTVSVGGDFEIGNGPEDSYVQSGGTVAVAGTLSISGSNQSGLFKQTGGRFEAGGSVSGYADSGSGGWCLSGGTFVFRYSHIPSPRLRLEGNPTIEVESGKTIRFGSPMIFADPDLELVKDGGGGLYFTCDAEVTGSLEVKSGSVIVGPGVTVRNVPGDYTPWGLKICDGASFYLNNISAHLALPIDFETVGSGFLKVSKSDNERHTVYASKAVTNGVELAAGAHGAVVNGAFRPAQANTAGAVFLVVAPTVWTGGGSDDRWGNPDNWEGGAVPQGDGIMVDLSRAKTIDLEDNIPSIRFFAANMTEGDRTLTVYSSTGNGYPVMNAPNYSGAALVGRGCTVEFRTKVMRNKHYCAFHGGGTFRFKGDAASAQGNSSANLWPQFCFGGVVEYSGVTNLVPGVTGSSYCNCLTYFSYGNHLKCEIVFGEGTDLDMDYLVWTAPGFTSPSSIRQRGADLTMKGLYIVQHSSTPYEDAKPVAYFLDSGSLTLSAGVYLGRKFFNASNKAAYEHGSFTMSGGVLTTPLMKSAMNQNWFNLNGGDVYLGSGGVQPVTDNVAFEKDRYMPNGTPALRLGGVGVHATADFSVGVDAEFSGIGGETVIDTAGHSVTFSSAAAVTGSGAFRKTGEGVLTFAGTNTFTGSLTVDAGSVAFAEGAETEVSLPMIRLASESSLSLAAGQELAVGELVVGGVRKAAGEYTFGNGTVTVSASGATVWCGDDDGNWNAAANWTAGVPSGDAVSVDFGLSALPDGYTVSLNGDVTLNRLSYAGGGSEASTLTLSATGDAVLNLAGGSVISVPPGDTLVIDADVMVHGGITNTGGGTIEFRRNVTRADDNPQSCVVLAVNGGTAVVANGSVYKFTLDVSTGLEDGRLSSFELGEGADMTVYAATGVTPVRSVVAETVGSVFRVDGGTAVFNTRVWVANVLGADERMVLDDGTVGFTQSPLVRTGDFTFEWNGGRVLALDSCTMFPAEMKVAPAGPMVFTQATETVTARVGARLTGGTSLVQEGPGELGILGTIDATTIDVRGGTLRFVEESAMSVPESSEVTMARGCCLDLDFDGVMTVKSLHIGGRRRVKGLYGAGLDAKLDSAFSGTGLLRVLEGEPAGTVITVR